MNGNPNCSICGKVTVAGYIRDGRVFCDDCARMLRLTPSRIGGCGQCAGNYVLSPMLGKAIQEIMRRYLGEELRPRVETWSAYYVGPPEAAEVQKDIDYIEQM